GACRVLSLLCCVRDARTFTLLPYTTLFRSHVGVVRAKTGIKLRCQTARRRFGVPFHGSRVMPAGQGNRVGGVEAPPRRLAPQFRSEEHTSELQSRENLVCRLLLEKKNIYARFSITLQSNIAISTEVLLHNTAIISKERSSYLTLLQDLGCRFFNVLSPYVCRV